jgi:hypothetical protein
MKIFFRIAFGWLVLPSLSVWAGENHSLSAAAGIVEPAVNTSLFQNPAGLASLKGPTEVALQTGASSSLGNPEFRAGVFTASDRLGLGVSVNYLNLKGSSADPITLSVGGSLRLLDSLSFGVSVLFNLRETQETGTRLGLIYDLTSSLKFALLVPRVQSGTEVFGFGLSYNIERAISLLVDGEWDRKGKDFYFRPALKAGDEMAALTVSYGIEARSSSRLWTQEGLSLGLHYGLGGGASVQFYLDQIRRYYASLVLRL